MKKQTIKIRYLDESCYVGERVRWNTITGKTYEGTLIKWEYTLATIKMDDGSEKEVYC